MSELLDSKFRIPGTNIRFGLDPIIGLIPYAGDVVTFAFSGLLVIMMARRGVSGMVVVKMLWNILIDTLVGAIPLLGDIFDFHFKANRRNYRLLKEHYQEGKHVGSAWPVIFAIILFLILLIGLTSMIVWKIIYWVFS